VGGDHAHIDRTVVEQVESFKFLGVQITKVLKWSKHVCTDGKKPRQLLLPLRRESILTGCITAWSCNRATIDCMALQRVVRTAQYITGAELPAVQDICIRRCERKARKIDSNHRSHRLFSLLPHGKRY
jgi:hypothetical protein